MPAKSDAGRSSGKRIHEEQRVCIAGFGNLGLGPWRSLQEKSGLRSHDYHEAAKAAPAHSKKKQLHKRKEDSGAIVPARGGAGGQNWGLQGSSRSQDPKKEDS